MPPPSRPSGVRSSLPAKSRPKHLEFASVFNETKLAVAIQTLDAAWKRSKNQLTQLAGEEEFTNNYPVSPPLSDSLRVALCTLLEIAAGFDNQDLKTKSSLVTICTARVLGCLKRFVANYTDKKPAIGECCDRKCEQRLLHLVLLNILFRMCKESEIARSVVKEGLHKFLLKMCTVNEMWRIDPNTGMDEEGEQEADTQHIEPFDPNDLMVAIDPFDWCYQPLCTRLLKENSHAFFIPVGIRSLICLLRGYTIPTDEVSEFQQQTNTHTDAREKSPKRRKLPSIFTFPLNEAKRDHDLSNKLQHKLTPLCCYALHEQLATHCLWSVVLNNDSARHMTLRSLIALVIYLPRPSEEYKSIMREREFICQVLHTYNDLPSSQLVLKTAVSWMSGENASDIDTQLLPFQQTAIQWLTLKRIARSALSLFANEHNASSGIRTPVQQISTRGRNTLSPMSKQSKNGKKGIKSGDCQLVSIQHRLNVAAKTANWEITQWESKNELHQQSIHLDGNRRRLSIRKMCADVESLRSHLLQSLEVLCSGRQHPDPQQSFSQWIKSLPTLETLERERQYQQEMRHRQILEQQYQRELLYRHERDECAQMQANDFNIPKENEVSIQQEKHERFIRMRAEMRQFEENDSDSDNLKGRADTNAARTPTKKEKLVIQERQRLLQLEDQRRERRELERMAREDMYYVERILQAKAKAKEEQEKRERNVDQHTNAIDEQRQRIARMRMLDEEKRLVERELIAMHVEDLVGRQIRYREAEKAKDGIKKEWRERKTMQAEEHDCRSRWTLWERALIQQQEEELKQQRAEARRLKRQQKREEEQTRAAWIESWDQDGNKYYYNSVTGVSQWEAPI